MSPVFSRRSRGTVILVALCFVAVMAIVLGSYLAVCTRAMQLSNRSFQTELSKQLAEAGLDEALRAFNKNNWDDWTSSGMTVDWDTATYAADKRAVATISFPSTKFAQGVTAEVKVRVDNADAPILGSSWSSSKNYRINDLVGYNGVWYRCVQNHSNQAPNGLATLAYWVPAPIAWTWQPSFGYRLYDVVNYDDNNDGVGTWFRCTTAHTSPATWSGANWTAIGAIRLYNAGNYHNVGDIVYNPDTTTWYRCTAAGTPGTLTATSMISWQYRSTTTYRYNDVVCYYTGGAYNWYRWINATSTSGFAPTNTTYWENALSGGAHGWSSSSINYNIGDVVYYSSTGDWYRCVRAHTSSGSILPSNTTYWADTPSLSYNWDPGPQYSANDVVSHNGVWYLSLLSNNSGRNPITETSYWIGADTTNTSYIWNRTTAYAAGAYRCYAGVWYRCLVTNTGESPSNTTYWTAAWTQSSGVTTGAPVVYAQATVTLGDGTESRTQLRAPIGPASLFPNAAAASTALTITGGSAGAVDSYDGSVRAMNTNGTYDYYDYTDQTNSPYSAANPNIGYSAVLAAGGSASASLTIGNNTAVSGYAAAASGTSSPFAPLASFGTSATVKSATSPLSPNVDLSRVTRSPYIPNFSIQSGASGSRISATTTTFNLGTPGATAPSTYYYLSTTSSTNLTLNSATEIVTIAGPVVLNITGNLRVNTNTGARFIITPTGSLRLNVARDFRLEAAGGGIENRTSDPKRLAIYCSRVGADTFEISSTTHDFIGTVFLPESSSVLTIASSTEIFGALAAQNITFSGAANLHYDTSLRYATFTGVDQPYTVTTWRELPATEQATMP